MTKMNIITEFKAYFADYIERTGKNLLTYVVTSLNRPNDPAGSPHKITGNAMDFTLRISGQYAPIREYNTLMLDMMDNWPNRAGVDNTPADGNVHIHIDLGQGSKTGTPYFFIENNGRWLKVAEREDFA